MKRGDSRRFAVRLMTPLVIAILIGAVLFVLSILNTKVPNYNNFLYENFGTILGIAGFYIAFATFLSVDFITVAAELRDNKLEDRNYQGSLLESIKKYDAKTKEEVATKLIHVINMKADSAMELVNKLQLILDSIMLLYPVKDQVRELIGSSLQSLKDQKNYIYERNNIPSKTKNVIDNTYLLIESIIKFQQAGRAETKFVLPTEMFSVDPSYLENSISKILYHTYIGLYYLNMAREEIRVGCHLDATSIFRKENLKKIYKMKHKIVDRSTILLLLEACVEHKRKAVKLADKNEFWLAYNLFDQARAEYLYCVIYNTNIKDSYEIEGYDWETRFNDAIKYRRRVQMIVEGSSKYQSNFLVENFKFESTYALLYKMNILASLDKKVVDSYGDELVVNKGIMKEDYVFVRPKELHSLIYWKNQKINGDNEKKTS